MERIRMVSIVDFEDGEEAYVVGEKGVTEIKKAGRKGLYNDIPYIEVYKNGGLFAEFCQHNIMGVYYFEDSEQPQQLR